MAENLIKYTAVHYNTIFACYQGKKSLGNMNSKRKKWVNLNLRMIIIDLKLSNNRLLRSSLTFYFEFYLLKRLPFDQISEIILIQCFVVFFHHFIFASTVRFKSGNEKQFFWESRIFVTRNTWNNFKYVFGVA